MKKIIIILLLIVVIVAGVMLVKKRKQSVAAAATATPISYTIKTVLPAEETVSQTRTFLARLGATHSAAISSKLSGQISRLLVTENQQVKSGELLVQIDNHEVKATIAALEAKFGAAKKQRDYNHQLLQRDRELYQVGGIAQEKFDASTLAYSTAAANVAELQENINGLRNQLDYLDLRAPFAGIVGTIFYRQGNLATPGRPILSLNSKSQKLTFDFSLESTAVRAGQIIKVKNAPVGHVTKIYNDAKNGLAVAEGTLDQPLAQPNGSFLTIAVVMQTAQGCAVPLEALLHRTDGVSLMVYQDGRFIETPVQVQLQNHQSALISPCVTAPVAIASEAKLSLLPGYDHFKVMTGQSDE
ncbi:MAG: efflux RND transporter periplasmic adaptor subunit [Desulfuromusa sp.]|nr:efflux RND transporter periplasmic adaptor subunit [Desulfuromusa sp.]